MPRNRNRNSRRDLLPPAPLPPAPAIPRAASQPPVVEVIEDPVVVRTDWSIIDTSGDLLAEPAVDAGYLRRSMREYMDSLYRSPVASNSYFTIESISGTVNSNMSTKEQEKLTDEFVSEYFKSAEWEKRFSSQLGNPVEIEINQVVGVALQGKKFLGKSVDVEKVNECAAEFLTRIDFVKVQGPPTFANALRDIYFKKSYMAEVVIGYEANLTPIMGQVPLNYVQVCPCCVKPHLHQDYLNNRRRGLQLCNSAHQRFFQAAGGNDAMVANLQIPIRNHLSRFVCVPCSQNTTYGWFQCSTCNRHEQREFRADTSSLRNYVNYDMCQTCLGNNIRDQMFVNHEISFQPASLDMNSRMRHVGCEFECYVKPKKLPSFDRRFVHQIKYDGSLNSQNMGIGVEVVTQPLLDWREEGITAICKELKEANVQVDTTCGGHIHVDSTGLNMNRANMLRMRNLFRIYESAFFAVCSKDRLNNSRYCAPVGLDNHSNPNDNRYVSLNMVSLQSHNTIEFRCFDGSADAEEWLSRIAFAEGFINFAKDSLNEMISGNDNAVLESVAKDSGHDTWRAVVDGYHMGRNIVMKELINKNGPALINLAGCRFKLKPSVINSLVKQYEKNWKL